MSASPHIVVVDDEAGILSSLTKIYEREGFQVTATDDGGAALEAVRAGAVDLVLSDIMMPQMNGIELLRAVKAISPSVEVIMMTAFGTIENAVECMREGAYDFITKPLKRALVVRSAQRALERRRLVRENRVLREAAGLDRPGDPVLGQSLVMTQTLDIANQAAKSEATILLLGESGTGKELLARSIHRASDRASEPFVAVNCGALPEALMESELFGHEKGAFTGALRQHQGRFERAHRGTIFLDEIGETSSAVQVKLLRVLQEGDFERVGGSETIHSNARVIAATNRDLEAAVKERRFREDLFYRLNVITIEIPPLRRRHGDIPILAKSFVRSSAEKNQKQVEGITEAALKVLERYSWPGNVRELENTIERAVVLCKAAWVDAGDLPQAMLSAAEETPTVAPSEGLWVPFGTPLAEIERLVLRETLKRTENDKKLAAHILGITSRTIYRKMSELEEKPQDEASHREDEDA